jgi:excisionase family DNA binding protein
MASEDERAALTALERLMTTQPGRTYRFVGPKGESVELPSSVGRILRQAISLLARGESVSLVPLEKDLTTQQAADILNVSRPYLVRLLETGKIPFTKTGSHRRVRLTDLLEYKRRRDAERREALAELTRLSQEAGLYSD